MQRIHSMKRWICIYLVLAALIALCPAAAAKDVFVWETVYTMADPQMQKSRINMTNVDGTNYLFLPEGYSAEALLLYFVCSEEATHFSIRGALGTGSVQSGDIVDLTRYCGAGTEYRVTLLAQKGDRTATLDLIVLPTGGVASLFLISEDPVNHGRPWVESSPDKTNKAKGSMLLLSPEGNTVYDGALTQIKGRGNSTWLADKKPYQIKLKDKTDLLETGDPTNAAKTWVLLTNHSDSTLLRNRLVYDLSTAMGMAPGIACRPVNLFYDGEYRGAYLLCEKVEIEDGRIDIADLEEANAAANPGVDLETLEVATGQTANGAHYTYCVGMTTPVEFTGGYLLEMETADRCRNEICYFTTTHGNCVVVKSPECASQTEMDYIASYYQDFEDTICNQGIHPTNGKPLDEYADINSLAQCYLVNELTKNPDGYRSSAYLYKDVGDAPLVAGPVWDYDLSFGHSWGLYVDACGDPEEYFTLHSFFAHALYTIPAFRQAVHDIYFDTVEPLLLQALLDGTNTDTALCAFSVYAAELAPSAYANAILWDRDVNSWQVGMDALVSYITMRQAWLSQVFADWSAEAMVSVSCYLDVPTESWYCAAITRATDYGLLNGKTNGIFVPDEPTTRAQATKVLYALSGDAAPTFHPRFSDVHSYDWFTPAVLWAAEHQVVLGYDDGRFGPDDFITRQDVVLLLYRYLGAPEAGEDRLSAFADGFQVGAYAREAMVWAVNTGLLQGYEDNSLRPLDEITRAEFATLIVRFYETFAEH